jgi:uncharacterized protein YndB with AHSA1/START domain
MTQATHQAAIVRTFNAPRALVFQAWLRPDDLATWFAPYGYAVTRCQVDPRPGGRWLIEFRAAGGQLIREFGEFRHIEAPERLVFTLTQHDGNGQPGPETLVTVTFTQRGSTTEMTFQQTGFDSATRRDGNTDGWQDCFDQLDQRLTGHSAYTGDSR